MLREEHRIPVRDSEIAAWLFRPDDVERSTPCVVLFHGFTATREDCRLTSFCEAFAGAGIAALAFDFRNLGASGGEPRQLVDLARQYEDCDAALRFAREHEAVDRDRVAVWGTSFAGGHALDAAVRHRWLAAAVCLVPFMDGAVPPPGMTPARAGWAIASAARDLVRAQRGRDPFLVRAVGDGGTNAVISNAEAWRLLPQLIPASSTWRNEVAARILLQMPRHRPGRHARQVACPLLVQIAGSETVVRNAPAVQAAKRAPLGELRRYADADHFDVYLPPVFDAVVADEVEFLKRHLSPAPARQRDADAARL